MANSMFDRSSTESEEDNNYVSWRLEQVTERHGSSTEYGNCGVMLNPRNGQSYYVARSNNGMDVIYQPMSQFQGFRNFIQTDNNSIHLGLDNAAGVSCFRLHTLIENAVISF